MRGSRVPPALLVRRFLLNGRGVTAAVVAATLFLVLVGLMKLLFSPGTASVGDEDSPVGVDPKERLETTEPFFLELELPTSIGKPYAPVTTLSSEEIARRAKYSCHLRHVGLEHEERWKKGGEAADLSFSCGSYSVVDCPDIPGDVPPGLLKGRALVLYMLHSTADTEVSKMPEWDNVEMMLAHGVLPNGMSTALFDGVDYVFYRIATHLKEPELCSMEGNLRFLWVPPGPCDLCQHARVLRHLGYSTGSSWPYRSIVLMNSGVRGPFVNKDGAHWIDVASMAGQTSRPRYGADDEYGFRTVGSPLMSWEYNPHPQSYFLVLPNAALKHIFSTLLNTCSDPTKTVCIFSGELILGDLLLDAGFSLHLFGFNATVTDKKSRERLRHQHSVETALNPTLRYHHPCKTMFTKFGGEVWKKKLVSEETIQAMRRFGQYLSLTGREYGVDFGFLEAQTCDILQ